MASSSSILLGTSAFTAAGWEGSFYPAGTKPSDYLTYYSKHFDTVEIDSTFYRIPALSTVNGWNAKTPKGFIFAAKVPQTITHEKVLKGCEAEFEQFVKTMDALGDKLGPMLLQFPYFNRKAFKSVGEFLALLRSFLNKVPKNYKFAVEIRNKAWLDARFADALREHGVALVLQDQSWMPRPTELFEMFDPVTADYSYIRWLGDRKGIEEQTRTWDRVIVDRSQELREWVNVVYKITGRGVPVFAYANNHYAGHAPATVEQFRQLWDANEARESKKPRSTASLF